MRSADRALLSLLALASCTGAEPPIPNPAPPATELAMVAPLEHSPHVMQAHRAGSGSALALVGGGLTGWASWEPHQLRLAAYRDVARLQPVSVQYGLDDRELPQDYSIKLESRALVAALDALGWTEPLDLVAWSFGAVVALDFALDSPRRIRTLTLIEPPALWVLPDHGRDDADVRQLAPMLRSLTGGITEAQLERWANAVGLVPPGTPAQSLPQWSRWMEHRRSLRNSSALLDQNDALVRLQAFDRPVLLITGTGTAPWLRRITDLLAEQLPDARVIEMPAGHAPQLVSMDRFLEEMAAFHREIPRPAR